MAAKGADRRDKALALPWLLRHGGIIRLKDIVQSFEAKAFLKLSRGYDYLIVDVLRNELRDVVDLDFEFGYQFEPSAFRKIKSYYRAARKNCVDLGLRSAVATIDRILRSKTIPTVGELRELNNELFGRISDELHETKLLALSMFEGDLYSSPSAGWETALKRYPGTRGDIEEASRCLACNRGTASVFHLMRVMEGALKVVGKTIDIPYAPSWKAYLTQMQTQLNLGWSQKTKKLKANEPYIREAHGLLSAVMVAWRNPTVHVRREGYTPEEAREVYEAVRGFMRHLSTKATRKRV